MAKRHESSSSEIASTESLARLHSLHGEVGSHGLGDRVNVLARLQALLGQQLDLGSPVSLSARLQMGQRKIHSYLFWNQI